MNKTLHRLSLLWLPLALVMGFGGAFLCLAKNDAGASRDDRGKASYIFLEAASRLSENNYGTAYHMLRRAAALDPSDDAIAAELAKIILITGLGDSAELENAYSAVRRLFFKNPSDVQNGYAFIKMAQQLRRPSDAKEAYRALMEAHPGNAEFALNYAGYRTMDFIEGDSTGISEASEIYDRLEAGMGINEMLTLQRLQGLALMGDTAQMIRRIAAFNATAPLDVYVNFYTGSMYDMVHLPDSAIVYYTVACELDSTFGPAYLARAEHFLAVGDSSRYDSEVLHALESPSLEFEAKYEILSGYARTMHADRERRDTFLNLFRKMLDIHPGEASLHYLYGAYLGSIDSVAAACEQFGYAMDLDPEEELYVRFRFQSAVQSADTAVAVAAARSAMERFDNVFYPVSAAALLQMQGLHDQAVELLSLYDVSRAEDNYQKSVFEQTLGDVLYAAGRKDSAYSAYDRALVYNPDNAGVLNNMAYFMALDGTDLEKAEKYVKRALLAEPDNPTYVDTYAWVLFRRKDYPAARRQIDRALEMYAVTAVDSVAPDSLFEVVVADHLEEIATGVIDGEDMAHRDSLVEEVIEEIEVPVPSSEIYDHAGDIYFFCGEPADALRFWKEALLLDPENEKIRRKVNHKTYFFD